LTAILYAKAVVAFVAVAPLSVEIIGDNKPLSEGKLHEISCKVVGAHPKPLITWFVGEDEHLNAGINVSTTGIFTLARFLSVFVFRDHVVCD